MKHAEAVISTTDYRDGISLNLELYLHVELCSHHVLGRILKILSNWSASLSVNRKDITRVASLLALYWCFTRDLQLCRHYIPSKDPAAMVLGKVAPEP